MIQSSKFVNFFAGVDLGSNKPSTRTKRIDTESRCPLFRRNTPGVCQIVRRSSKSRLLQSTPRPQNSGNGLFHVGRQSHCDQASTQYQLLPLPQPRAKLLEVTMGTSEKAGKAGTFSIGPWWLWAEDRWQTENDDSSKQEGGERVFCCEQKTQSLFLSEQGNFFTSQTIHSPNNFRNLVRALFRAIPTGMNHSSSVFPSLKVIVVFGGQYSSLLGGDGRRKDGPF